MDMLAPYAAHSSQTRGRMHSEPSAAPRTEFQRDRDRIIHSTARFAAWNTRPRYS